MISNTPAVYGSNMLETSGSLSDYVINSPQSCINEWHVMSDLLVKRPPSPDRLSVEVSDIESLIKTKLREIMKTVDLDNITSKSIRSQLEVELKEDLEDYKSFIDKEILVILGQMDPASKILEYLYLGSEWNASNLDELKANGITHILNVTREIDNFFPAVFEYRNIRVYDEESTDLLKWFDDTYRFIKRARSKNGKVLIHCKMGISRSATVTMSYIMKEYERSLEDVLIHVKERREVVNPNKSFIKQLEVYEGILGAIRNRHNGLFRSKSESSLKDDVIVEKAQRDKRGKKVKALADVFNRPSAQTFCYKRPKSWSPNERISHLLLGDDRLIHIDEECRCYDINVFIHNDDNDDGDEDDDDDDDDVGRKTRSRNTVNSYSGKFHCGCNVELELKVGEEEDDDDDDYNIVRNLSNLPIRLRHNLDESLKVSEEEEEEEEDIHERDENYPRADDDDLKEELSVKTIANMFDFKETSSSSVPRIHCAKLEDSKLFRRAQKLN